MARQPAHSPSSNLQVPAEFGPPLPDRGVDGLLVVADPEAACSPLKPPPVPGRWVALILRTQGSPAPCHFDLKVLHAEAAGASAAIVYDDMWGPLVVMSRATKGAEPGIPAVFVSRASGLALRARAAPGLSRVLLLPPTDADVLSMLGTVSACMLLSMLLALWLIRRQSEERWAERAEEEGAAEGGMTAHEVRALPLVVFRDDGEEGEEEGGGGGGGGKGAVSGVKTLLPPPRLLPLMLPPSQNASAAGRGHLIPPLDTGGPFFLPARHALAFGYAPPGSSPPQTAWEPGSSPPPALRPCPGFAPTPPPLVPSYSSPSLPSGKLGGSTRSTCVVCLDNYRSGDALRVLPCAHRFHAACIDQWLTSRPPLCPLCKADARAWAGEGQEGKAARARPASRWPRRAAREALEGLRSAGRFLRRNFGGSNEGQRAREGREGVGAPLATPARQGRGEGNPGRVLAVCPERRAERGVPGAAVWGSERGGLAPPPRGALS